MCGIVGGIKNKEVIPFLTRGLHSVDYRGYDSAGLAVIQDGKLVWVKSVGNVLALEKKIEGYELSSTIGIAHTRWATHGTPSEINAHPHISHEEIAVVHNGIIENHVELRILLEAKGYVFVSDTDTEVIAHLIHSHLVDGSLFYAVQSAVKELEGSYAIAVLWSKDEGRIIVARHGSPLVIGYGDGEMFVASDASALLSETNRFVYLEDGEVADVVNDGVVICNDKGLLVKRDPVISTLTLEESSLNGFAYYMQKEIYDQPEAILHTVESAFENGKISENVFGKSSKGFFRKVTSVQIIACGTSYHAGLVAKYWLQDLAGISCNVDFASEFRYGSPRLPRGTLIVFISQSGETADTLACVKMIKKQSPYSPTFAICNVPESSLTRDVDLTFLTRAGKEIGVASTKAFTAQLVALLVLTVALGRVRNTMSSEIEKRITKGLLTLPAKISEALELDSILRMLAPKFVQKEHCLYLGRGVGYPIALEGALKLKEISYIHAEGYPAGELKHGPLALVDGNIPVIAVAPNDSLAGKLQSNLREVRARNGKLFIFASPNTKIEKDEGTEIIIIPEIEEILIPFVTIVPLQLLAYHVAVLLGKDVDKPRNLAKSVTVE